MKPVKKPTVQSGGDPLLREIWRIKDELSAARGHSIDRLFADNDSAVSLQLLERAALALGRKLKIELA